MPIVINLDVMLAKRKMSVTELARRLDLNITKMSLLKSGNIRLIRLITLDEICDILDCQPGDILERVDAETYKKLYGKEWRKRGEEYE